ncbi:DUF4374 domain-containing protein [Mesonia maritima]|uniref:DUF4374 domain-containing protein n=1 Tax=Mesonia maritima TaxID=1793873 RepID=A0ABU1K1T4_9FLAO|nr:DUF4374 domain-containing protein [Mesonia maritima]MDR6299557.1 hypothetical protein [Mesonia maritima]
MAFLSFVGILSFTACSSDDDNTSDEPEVLEKIIAQDKPYVLSLSYQGSDDNYTYYTVPFENIMEGTLSAEGTGIEQPGYFDFTQIEETIYSIGGLDDVNVAGMRKRTIDDSDYLVKIGDVSFSQQLEDIIKADNNTLVSISMDNASDIITFRKFNKNSLNTTETKNVQVSEFTSLTGPSYSGMVVADGHLFLSYYISDPDSYATDYTDQAEVAVFSYPELEFQKVITDDRVGPIGGFLVKSGLIKDEDGNIYAISHSNPANGFSQSTKPSGILKINSGETDFDQDYFFDVESASGGGNVVRLKYLENGKAYAEINTAERSQQDRWMDGPSQSAVINLEAKTIQTIANIPEHLGLGRRLVALQEGNTIYTCIPITDDGNYIYKINTETLQAEKGAKVEANFTAGIFKL